MVRVKALVTAPNPALLVVILALYLLLLLLLLLVVLLLLLLVVVLLLLLLLALKRKAVLLLNALRVVLEGSARLALIARLAPQAYAPTRCAQGGAGHGAYELRCKKLEAQRGQALALLLRLRVAAAVPRLSAAAWQLLLLPPLLLLLLLLFHLLPRVLLHLRLQLAQQRRSSRELWRRAASSRIRSSSAGSSRVRVVL
jgi:hypothetical protein